MITHLRLVAPALAAAAVFCAGWQTAPAPMHHAATPAALDAPATLDADLAALHPSDLQDGDLAMIAGNTAAGAFVLSISGEQARYSHCGLIVRAGGEWVLVHVAPANADAGDRGFTESVSLGVFCARRSVRLLDVYRHADAAAAARAAVAARSFALAAIPFDGSFDLLSDDKLYCTELVWKCYLAAGAGDPLHGRLDRGRGPFAPQQMILPHSLAISDQFRRVGVLVIDPLLVRHP